MGEEKKQYNFKNFKLRPIQRAPLNDRAYRSRWGGYRANESVEHDFTLEEIQEIIRTGDLESIRQLSRYYYRTDSNYHNNIDFLAHLFLYSTVVVPLFEENKGSQVQILKSFYNACHFIDKLDCPNTLGHITTEWLITGIYNGILREDGDKVVVQDLPLEYCRSRFKDFNNLNVLEFNLRYFEHFTDEATRTEVLATFPKIVQQAWRRWINHTADAEQWVLIPAELGGISFSFATDQMPLLIATITELKKLDDATGREEKRDENELYKLLIQQMPIDKDGELVFQLEEVADIHASVADMLKDEETVEVLTTFGNTSLENLQDSSAASQSTDRLEKYRKNVWDALGRGEILFNPTTSSALSYSIKKDETIMLPFLNTYETWLKYLLNERFARKGLCYDFEILPVTLFNASDMQQTYFRGAQYGYSKMFAGVAMGIKQMDQISLMNFENDFLKMSEKMVPLQSSYTTSGKTIIEEEKNSKSGQKTVNTTSVEDLTNTGGRPELPDEQKSDKTQSNIDSAG